MAVGWAEGGRALVVIDMQHSYFELPGLADKEDQLVPRVNELIRAADEAGRAVILVRTQHEPDRSTWTLNMLEDNQGFAFPGSEQAQFLDALEPDGVSSARHVEVVKTRDSAFHGTQLDQRLRALGVSHLLLCGVSTHSCVKLTATDAFAHNFHVAIAHDAVASEDPELAEATLGFLQKELRQQVLPQAEALEFLRQDG